MRYQVRWDEGRERPSKEFESAGEAIAYAEEQIEAGKAAVKVTFPSGTEVGERAILDIAAGIKNLQA